VDDESSESTEEEEVTSLTRAEIAESGQDIAGTLLLLTRCLEASSACPRHGRVRYFLYRNDARYYTQSFSRVIFRERMCVHMKQKNSQLIIARPRVTAVT